jgi:DNA modification methylase
MIIEIKKISELTPAPYNPRESTEKQESQLKQSLKKFGVVEPIIYNKQTGYIVGGHFRVRELQKLGYTEIECVIVDLSEEDEKELNIRLNANTGQWDWDELANNFELEDLNDWGLEVPNMKHELEAEDDNFEEPETIETDIVLGDLFEIGEHRLLCGDSGIVENLDKLMNGDKADMVFTDPPYGMNYIPNHNKARENNKKGITYNNVRHQEMVIGDDEDYNPSFLMQYFDECKEQFWWGADYYIDKINEFKDGNLIVWNKRFGIEDMNWSSSHFELCFSRQPHLKEVVNIKWFGVQGTEKQDVRTRIHTTQKPIQLPAWFIEKHGKNSNIIVDIYLGSGTTMVASHQLKRKCYGMELDPKYCQVIIDRMKKLDPTLKIKKNGVEI